MENNSCIEQKLAKRLVFAHNKGGTGKTSACLNIAGWLSKMGQKVLVIDLDPQANATSGLGVNLKTIEHSMHHVLLREFSLADIVLQTTSGVYLAPASFDLLSTDNELLHQCDITLLNNKLLNVDMLFDFILIDSPPGSSILMLNALMAARNLIIPLDAGVFSYETLEMMQRTITILEKEFNIKINILMTLLKNFSSSFYHRKLTKNIRKYVENFFSDYGFENYNIFTIPFSNKVHKAQIKGLPISHYAPCSFASRTYRKIAQNICCSVNQSRS